MKITMFPLSVSVASLLAVLGPVQYAQASDLVTNCVQVTSTDGVDSDSTPDNKAGFQGILDAVNATPPANEDDESCVKVLIPFDYGDAPDSPDTDAPEPDYPTLSGSDGARHQLGTDVYLGQCVDTDLGDTALDAGSDDSTFSSPYWGNCAEQANDEDGVIFSRLRVGEQDIRVNVTASKACQLNAWIDWEGDGSWAGVTEQVFVDEQLSEGFNQLTLSVPTLAKAGETYARFRCSTAGGDGITGEAADGEVEDYKVVIEPAIPAVPLSVGDHVWLDDDKDGIQGADEAGLVDAQVDLLKVEADETLSAARDLNGVVVPTQTITATGQYEFTNLPEGEYIIRVTPPGGYVPTSGGDDVDTNDSNTDSNCQMTDDGIQTLPFLLTAGNEPIAGIDGDDNNGNMTVDCGFHQSAVPKYSVGNQIWIDGGSGNAAHSNNGLKDPGESNVSAILQVELRDSNNGILQQTTSNNGFYLFSGLEAGDYTVCLTAANFAASGPLAGYTASTGSDESDPNLDVDSNDNGSNDPAQGICSGLVTLGTDEPLYELPTASDIAGNDGAGTPDENSNLTVDFGVLPPATAVVPLSVGNLIWNDVDEDGGQDDDEVGLADVQVTLLKPDGSAVTDLSGNEVLPQTTDTSGLYQFTNLPGGDYIVRASPPAGFVLTAGGADVDVNVDDQDSNGVEKANGPETEPFTLAAGTEPVAATDGDDNNGNMTVDFGFYESKEAALALGNYVWVDANVDGLQTLGEKPLQGVTVELTDVAGNSVTDIYGGAVISQTTGADGRYRFGDLPGGDYIVNMSAPAGYYRTTGGLDVDDDDSNTDSNCIIDDAGLIKTHAITLSDNSEPAGSIDGDNENGNMTVDCGFYSTVSVGNYIWNDANANGTQDTEESGMADVTVSLTGADGISPAYDVNGNLVAPVVTNASGLYEFTDLEPGEYSVTVTPPEDGYQLSQGGSDPDNNASDSDSNCVVVDSVYQTPAFKLPTGDKTDNLTVDCGLYRSVGVGSRIWIDLDSDGVQDPGEPGVPRSTVTLLNPDGTFAMDLKGNVVQPQLTSSNGEYFFGDLREGDYVVKVTPPAGYLPTIDNGDPDNDDGTDSNGVKFTDGSVLSDPITLSWGQEPDTDGDGDASTNLTVGFGFTPTAGTSVQIPTASTWTLGLMSMLLSMVAFWRRRRDS
ncbi:MAG: IPTL-CTERM protein sorting domain-containing protein [uncultured Thiotrichaceae bacterium]|uniref:IPTL-CTERM protein sorting domain-containing protein n=1 Tax=uncultured Thiotrichaceae bacterium TaxID=298394 RepID=A0A6S6TYU7_9GAMM|nr:MAG: IPTL-CTERM protein sorting domain-containing protein [uncultured Thiotrichaceae bacterium]